MTSPRKGNPTGNCPHNPGAKAIAKALDRQSIESKALAYLDRFDASASRLRRVLEDFVKRRACALAVDPGPFLAMAAEIVTRYQENGLLDDRRFGTAMATHLAERGVSRQVIRVKLRGRGLAGELANEVTQALGAQGHSELEAARTLVKKRKLGNFRPESERRAKFQRDLAVLARAGFDFDIAKRALAVEGADAEEEF